MRVDRETHRKYFDESDAGFQARMLWYDFKDTIINDNRFFVSHKLLDILLEYISNNVLDIETGHIYYRARIIDDNSINDHMVYKCISAPDNDRLNIQYSGKANPFKGLTKEASFVPPKGAKIPEGRANPRYIRYLYVSESATTAIFEVRPFIFDAVNVAKIRVNSPLRIANIAVEIKSSDTIMEDYVMRMIQGAFSKPTNNPDDYIYTQVIAGYIKSLGYDGMRFNSSLHYGGVNLTIFNHKKCEAISSQDFRIEDIKLTARAAFGCANYQGDLFYIRDNEPLYIDSESNEMCKK